MPIYPLRRPRNAYKRRQIYDATVADIDSRENRDATEKKKKQQETLQELLSKYRDFEAQRAAIKKQGDDDIAQLESQRTAENSDEIDRAIAVAKEQVTKGIQSINDAEAEEASKDNDFLKKLFGDYSSMSFDSLQKLISRPNSSGRIFPVTGIRKASRLFRLSN